MKRSCGVVRGSGLAELARILFDPTLGLRRPLALAAVLDAAVVLLGTAAPLLLKALVDQLAAFPTALGAQFYGSLAGYAASALAPSLLAGLAQSPYAAVVEALEARITRSVLAAQLGGHGADRHEAGAVLARLPAALDEVVAGLFGRTLPTALQVLASLWVILSQTPPAVALIAAATLALYAAMAASALPNLRRRASALNEAAATSHARVADVLAQQRRVEASGSARQELAAAAHLQEVRRRLRLDLLRAANTEGLRQTLVLAVGAVLVLGWSSQAIARHSLSLGGLVLVQAYVFRLAAPVAGVAAALGPAVVALETLKEAFALSDHEPAASAMRPPPQGDDACEPEYAGVLCQGVDLLRDARPVLKQVSFRLEPGAFVVLAGANGSGKSSLARVMVGLEAPREGRVTVAGRNPASLAPEARSRLALLVPQSATLLARSLGENGLYPPSEDGREDLQARLARWRFYPNAQAVDLERRVGAGGERLSGGQVQKLDLARAMAAPARMLILDESTSALDHAARDLVLEDLRRAFRHRVLVVITHDPEIAALADEVLFLRAGRLALAGPHATLLQHADYLAFWRGSRAEGAPEPIG